ncbi:MAG: hypothetical protein HY703_10815 [Gemmatimonadetes bacterium]|nr:hypothetical protein [Gemmatimonadota bacterium]
MKKTPFGDEPRGAAQRVNPFGDEAVTQSPAEAAERIENAARRIRGLRSQLGSEGLTLTATRELIDELASGLEAAARALRGLAG